MTTEESREIEVDQERKHYVTSLQGTKPRWVRVRRKKTTVVDLKGNPMRKEYEFRCPQSSSTEVTTETPT